MQSFEEISCEFWNLRVVLHCSSIQGSLFVCFLTFYVLDFLICVCFVCTSGLVEMPTTIRWSSDVIQCRGHGGHSRSLVVIEEAFYVRPSPEVCDSKCRLGPNATRDECYFHGRACVQLASERDVSALYDSCFPVAAPSACNFTDSGLPDSLWVGYSCVDGKVTPDDFSFLREVSAFVLKKKKKKVRIILIQFYDLQCQLTQSQLQVLFLLLFFICPTCTASTQGSSLSPPPPYSSQLVVWRSPLAEQYSSVCMHGLDRSKSNVVDLFCPKDTTI